jgi:hypothetical protein
MQVVEQEVNLVVQVMQKVDVVVAEMVVNPTTAPTEDNLVKME